ncbi:MAG: putative glycolipid-binding domain-containing protein [Candidatus Rokuibacteriota bacterium]
MSRRVVVRWRDWSGDGLEHLVLEERPDGVHADAAILGNVDSGEAFAARYRIDCDGRWRVRRLRLTLLGRDTELELSSDGSGDWADGSGTPRPDLAGTVDVDISATPFTNTLPIRRLTPRAGESETIRVVYVRLPELTVTVERQRYTCLEPGRRYRFESLESGFAREIEVDGDGLVVMYPDLFRRVR